MRIPIPVVLLLCLLVVAGVWMSQTRRMDFMTPPKESRLEEVRTRVKASLPESTHSKAAITASAAQREPIPPPEVVEPKPPIEFGDLNRPPVITEYVDLAPKGAPHLIELAVLLETEGEFQRALLAWERVLDSGKPDPTQAAAAVQAIKRLRPTLPDWNTIPEKRIPIVLHAGTGKKAAAALKPILEETAKDIERASAGILQVTARITAGKDAKRATGPAPVALWLAGPAQKSRSTEVLSFTVGTKESLPDEVRKTAFQVIRGYVGRGIQQSPPPPAVEGETLLDAMQSHITRLLWRDLGILLNHPPEKSE